MQTSILLKHLREEKEDIFQPYSMEEWISKLPKDNWQYIAYEVIKEEAGVANIELTNDILKDVLQQIESDIVSSIDTNDLLDALANDKPLYPEQFSDLVWGTFDDYVDEHGLLKG